MGAVCDFITAINFIFEILQYMYITISCQNASCNNLHGAKHTLYAD